VSTVSQWLTVVTVVDTSLLAVLLLINLRRTAPEASATAPGTASRS
jgi:hypothetical protein